MSGKADARTYNSGGPGTLAEEYRQAGRQGRDALSATHLRPGGGGDEAGRTFGDKYDGGDCWAGQEASGTSIFDPVLCELIYRWFCVPGGTALDPFAGGSVRGIVAATLGLQYVGIDLSERQVDANREQAKQICGDGAAPTWIVGDSRDAATLAAGEYDLVFSCPPYFDLEVYSDDPADLSRAGDYGEFADAYRSIIHTCVGMLKPNRFACFVVGDVRDKKGFYCNLPGDTIAAFEAAGARLYNEAILVTAVGSLPIRVGKQFASGRKLGKTHQNVLVFYKGDPKAIKDEFPKEVPAGELPDG